MTTMLTKQDVDLLCQLLGTPTVGPLETGPADPPPQLWQAQHAYARAAAEVGLSPVYHASPAADVLAYRDVPVTIGQAAAANPEFLAQQPSLVLRLGPELPRVNTVMLNVHLDTVAGFEPVSAANGRYFGRGAIDAKGPAVALLAGIREATQSHPALGRDVGVLVQVVSGEEGGAMGTFGTRPLVDDGFVGRLNIFCEPTDLHYLPRSTASMTARLRVAGNDAVDDHPDAGHNATVLLGHLAQHLASQLDTRQRPGRVCIAGIGTGELHNRVYGTGGLLLNLSYATSTEGADVAAEVESAVASGLAQFTARFGHTREFSRTARDAAAVTRLEWLKRGLPCLHNTDIAMEALFERAGAHRWPDDETAFTCDAIWMSAVPEAYTAVLGPGSLEKNNAHAAGEYADHEQLDAFATSVAALLVEFAEQRTTTRGKGTTDDRPA